MSFTAEADAQGDSGAIAVRASGERPLDAPPSPRPSFGWRSIGLMVAGGLLTGSLAAAALAAGAEGDDGFRLEPVARSELATASQSLLPAEAAGLVAEAEACRAPLATLTIRASAATRGVVRIRSGAYVTPNLQLGPRPDRVAIPSSAPYLAGRGRISIESVGEGADIFLRPGRHVDAGTRTTVIDVRWTPKAPC